MSMRIKMWDCLDRYLYLTALSDVPAEEVYAILLSWKGEVGARQQQIRRLRDRLKESGNQRALKMDEDLVDATRSLAALSRSTAVRGVERQAQLDSLNDKIEGLQKELSSVSADFRKQRDQQHRTPDEIRTALPANTALVDLIAYQLHRPSGSGVRFPRIWPRLLSGRTSRSSASNSDRRSRSTRLSQAGGGDLARRPETTIQEPNYESFFGNPSRNTSTEQKPC